MEIIQSSELKVMGKIETEKEANWKLKYFPHRNSVYILCTKIVQDVSNWCIQDVYKMYSTFWHAFA